MMLDGLLCFPGRLRASQGSDKTGSTMKKKTTLKMHTHAIKSLNRMIRCRKLTDLSLWEESFPVSSFSSLPEILMTACQ